MQHKIILFFDSNCLMCHWFVKFICKRDRKKLIYFSDFNSKSAIDYDVKLTDNTLVLIINNIKYKRSKAIIEMMKLLDFPKKFIKLIEIMPLVIRDFIYNLIASNRYLFKKSKSNKCSTEINKRSLT